jgi:hypothetical protein
MSTIQRIGFAFGSTIALGFVSIIYERAFKQSLVPLISTDGIFSEPVFILERIVPVLIAMLLLGVWIWVIWGAVQDERTVDRRRVRR